MKLESNDNKGDSTKNIGSSNPDEPIFLVVGKIRKPHGVRGEVSMEVLTDFPERLVPGVVVYIGEDFSPEKIAAVRWHKDLLLVRFTNFQDRESVAVFRNKFVYVHSDDRPQLAEGEYYHHELIGLKVVTDEGEQLGILIKILMTGANDVYVIQDEKGKELLLPAIASVIMNIDVNRGEMIVRLLPGLIL